MPTDDKAEFYWKNRERIEEWANLVPQTRAALFDCLVEAMREKSEEPSASLGWQYEENLYGSWAAIRLPLNNDPDIRVGIVWKPSAWKSNTDIVRGLWPELAITTLGPSRLDRYDELKARLSAVAGQHGMTTNAKGEYLWFGQITLLSTLDLRAFASKALERLESAHAALLPETTAFFAGAI